MSRFVKYFVYLCFLCGALAFAACSSNDKPDDLDPLWPEGYDPEVTLAFKVSIENTSASSVTRTESNTGRDLNETDNKPSVYELINSLRIIIVRPDNTIEWNRLVEMTEPVNFVNELEFKVSTSQGETEDLGYASDYARTEIKRIYLIANEASITPVNTLNAFKDLKEGDTLTPETAASWIISNTWSTENDLAVPILNNEGQNKGYVPMTEFYDIPVRANLMYPELTREQNEHLFITRNYVKFQFHVKGNPGSAFRISKIRFENLMQKEFLFPNGVEYSPSKYTDGKHLYTDGVRVNNLPQNTLREIEKYNTPGQGENNLIRPYEFYPEKFGYDGLNAVGANEFNDTYMPELYFCESANFSSDWRLKYFFNIGIEVEFINPDNTTELLTFEPKELGVLAYALPRNTIVQVNMTLQDRELLCAVTLVPYIGVELEPVFGFEDLRPNKQ